MDFLVLLFAHLLADYPLQGAFLSSEKGRNYMLLATHAGIWTGTVLIFAHFLGYDVDGWDVAILFIVHAIADLLKARALWFYKNLKPLGGALFIDQLIHVAQIVVFLLWMTEKVH